MDTSYLLDEWYNINPDIEKNYKELLTKEVLKRRAVPSGYTWNEGDKYCKPNKELIDLILYALGKTRYQHVWSLQDAYDYLYREFEERGAEPVTTMGGISNLFTKFEKKLGISDKETTAERLKRTHQLAAARRREKGLKRAYNLSHKQREKIEVQKKLTKTKKEIEELKRKERSLKRKAALAARRLKLKGDVLKEKPKADHTELAEDRLPEDRPVAFKPNPGPQTDFLASDEDIVLYGGAAGGGKSYALVVDALRYAHHKAHRAVLIRKTMPELKELIDISRELYPKYDPKAKYRETDHIWIFSSGAQIMFRFLERPADKYKFQGLSFTYIGFDELSQHDTPEGFNYLRSRLRRSSENSEIRPYIRATANPGSMWVYEMFIKGKTPNEPFILEGTEHLPRPVTCKFIPAKLEDNPYLNEDGEYRSILESLDHTLKRQLLDGDWLASVDSMFPEFNIKDHVIEPFPIPKHWNRVAGLDYGYKDPAAAVWFAIDPEDGSIIVYDEFLERGLTGREFALKIKEKEQDELVRVDHPIDWSVFARTGHTGPTIAESMLSVPGFSIRKADKNREAGWVQIHEYLRKDPKTGLPKMRIFSTCKNLINQLMAVKAHPTKPNDIDDSRNQDGHWDLLDALRYGIMSRPKQATYEDRMLMVKQGNTWDRYRSYFS